MKTICLCGLMILSGCGFKAYRSPQSQTEILDEQKTGQGCDGRAAQGTAIVRAITPSRSGRDLVAGRQYVHFDFVQKRPNISRVQMIISMTEECLAVNHLAVNQTFNTTAWIRTAGTCRPYILSIPGAACVDQQSFADEAD